MARLLHLLLLGTLALVLCGAPALLEACACCEEVGARAAAPVEDAAGDGCRDEGCAAPCARCACGGGRLLLGTVPPVPSRLAHIAAAPLLRESDRGRLHRPRIFVPPRQGV